MHQDRRMKAHARAQKAAEKRARKEAKRRERQQERLLVREQALGARIRRGPVTPVED